MKVAILGYGVEGRASYNYWQAKDDEVVIVDEKNEVTDLPAGAQTMLGAGVLDQLEDFDLVVRTPQLRPDKIKTTGQVWSATNEFFANCPAPIIGVTGTKGKGTTATLIAEILKTAGKTIHLVGNIGVPALPELAKIKAKDLVVFELSSFQLWDLKKSPETAVVLMIEPDHMDVHVSLEEYITAKTNIAVHQSPADLVVYHPTNQFSAQIAQASPGVKKQYLTAEGAQVVMLSTRSESSINSAEASSSDLSTSTDVFAQDDNDEEWIIVDGQPICKTAEVGLIGTHNLENICAAITAVWRYAQDIAAIKKAVTNFKGLPHRLELVRELHGVKYYNDSFSSAAGATIAAIKSFAEPVVLIAGGYEKGADFKPLAKVLQQSPHVKKILLIGTTGPRIAEELAKAELSNFEVIADKDFQLIIKRAQTLAETGDVVLLSPGSASYDMFKNFYERGEKFKSIVRELD